MFNSKKFNSKKFSSKISRQNVIAQLALSALFAALCVLPACSINANDKGKDGEKQVDIKSPIGDLHVSEQADIPMPVSRFIPEPSQLRKTIATTRRVPM